MYFARKERTSTDYFLASRNVGMVVAREGHLGTHSFRHSHRSWLDALGSPLSVQQRAMRHADIRQTMEYRNVIGDELRKANSKVVGELIGPKVDREAS